MSKVAMKTRAEFTHPAYNHYGSFTIHYSGLNEQDVEYLENAIDLLIEQAEHDRGFNE